jgi:retron-type reverse transcriptase
MKRHGNLFDKITDLDNIKAAHKYSRRGKAFYTEVKMVDSDLDRYCKEIQKSLVNQTFNTSEYEVEDRFDGRKMRTIYKLPYYPDRIVQHALLNVVGQIFTNCYIRDSFQSIIGRGTSDAMRRVKQVVRSPDCPRYALKIDVEKYYPSVDNAKLKVMVRRKIKCTRTLWLFDNIIDSMKGLPIGNYTSQHLGNLYLNDFDWQVKQNIKPKAYFRYCDDIIFMDDMKSKLLAYKTQAIKWLADLGLKIKDNWNIYDIYKQGIDFVGYVFTPFNTRLRPTIVVKFKLVCKRITRKVIDPSRDLSRVMAYKGWAKHCNGKLLWRKHTQPLRSIFPKQLRGAI